MPTTLKITYFDSTNGQAVLGYEETSSISELPYPAADRSHHFLTITKVFDGQNCHRWKVCRVAHINNSELEITLEPRYGSRNEVFLQKTIKDHGVRSLLPLRKGALVEVDFGFIYSVKKASGHIGTCKRYVDQPSKGEMHKRRLAIVVKATRERIQVVPITSQTPIQADVHTSFQLEGATLSDLVSYNDTAKRSFAIAGMIQSVSPTRVLPPMTINNRGYRKRDTRYPYRLSPEELLEFERCLANAVGLSSLLQLKESLRLETAAHQETRLELDRLRDALKLAQQKDHVKEVSAVEE